MRFMYPILASIAGAITALAFRPLRGLNPWQIALIVFMGFTFAYFCGPWAVAVIMANNHDVRMQGGIYYLLATGSNGLIAAGVRWVGRVFGIQPETPQ